MGIDDNKGTAVSMTLVYHAIYVVNTVQVCGASVIPDSLKACCLIPMITWLLEKAIKDPTAKQQTP